MTARMRKLPIYALILLALTSCGKGRHASFEPHDLSELSGLRVAVTTGTIYEIELSKRDDIRLMLFNDDSDVIESLVKGMSDVCVVDEIKLLSEARKEHGLKVAFYGDESYPTAFCFRKGDRMLKHSFDYFLSSIKADGTLDSLVGVWLSPDFVPSEVNGIPDGEGEPLRVATANTIAPISYLVDNEWYGLEVEIMKLYGRYAGRRIEIVHVDFGSVLLALQSGRADVAMGCLFITKERMRGVDFSEPYHEFRPAYVVRDPASEHASMLRQARGGLYRTLIVENRWKYIVNGFRETVKITLWSILLGSILGCGLCAMLRSRRKLPRKAAHLYCEVIEGIPVLVLLLIMFYVVLENTGIGAGWIAIIAFSLYFAAVSASIFSSSLKVVPDGQREAGLALGFTRFQTFFRIVFPQALRYGVPHFKAAGVSLLKETALVGFIAIQDLTRASDIIRTRTFDAFTPLIVVSVLYFLLAWLMGKLLDLTINKKRAL